MKQRRSRARETRDEDGRLDRHRRNLGMFFRKLFELKTRDEGTHEGFTDHDSTEGVQIRFFFERSEKAPEGILRVGRIKIGTQIVELRSLSRGLHQSVSRE
jgi:hypothetical protein